MTKTFFDYKEDIFRCSKCGLCMAVCPLYSNSKNDCANARGLFTMLRGVINGDLEFDETIFNYLSKCENCDKCKNFCPSGIDIPSIISSAKEEYTKRIK